MCPNLFFLSLQMRLLVFITLLVLVNCEEQYQDSSEICTKCDCKTITNTFYMNCSGRNVRNTLANWPKLDGSIKLLVVTFNNNTINRLKRMPGIGVQLKLAYDHCGIKEIDSDLFESCSNVTYLDLSYNNLESE